MSLTLDQAEKLLSGNHSFSQLGFSLMVMRMKSQYRKNPDPATLRSCTDEINAFLQKFSMVMAGDYAVISEL
jgi:hypothetical protein